MKNKPVTFKGKHVKCQNHPSNTKPEEDPRVEGEEGPRVEGEARQNNMMKNSSFQITKKIFFQ